MFQYITCSVEYLAYHVLHVLLCDGICFRYSEILAASFLFKILLPLNDITISCLGNLTPCFIFIFFPSFFAIILHFLMLNSIPKYWLKLLNVSAGVSTSFLFLKYKRHLRQKIVNLFPRNCKSLSSVTIKYMIYGNDVEQ